MIGITIVPILLFLFWSLDGVYPAFSLNQPFINLQSDFLPSYGGPGFNITNLLYKTLQDIDILS